MNDNELVIKFEMLGGSITNREGAQVRGLRAVAAAVWDEVLEEIECHELNTIQAREGNPYRETAN